MTEAANTGNEEEQQDTDQPHPIAAIISGLVHRVLDIEECASEFITISSKKYNKNAARLDAEVKKCQELLNNSDDHAKRLVGVRNLRRLLREIERHNNSSPTQTLERSLFVSLFAAFDKFLGDLVASLYSLKPELYSSISKEVPLSAVLKHSNLEELRASVLDEEIENIRRKSYRDQFSDLEKRFSIKLKKFDLWPAFIECSQRRNLFTHCDGVVSDQYLAVCQSVNFKFPDGTPNVGDQLNIGAKYFFSSCHTVVVTAVMLGQTLWRKLLPKETSSSDKHLSEQVFNFLHLENFDKSIALSKFALALPEISDEQMERIFCVNYAIALKAIGKPKAAIAVLEKRDWSAASYDFRLAYSVLTENYKDAKTYMLRIGKNGELISEYSYHDWPLFRDFREQEEFFEGYREVYGYKYSEKLASISTEVETKESEGQSE